MGWNEFILAFYGAFPWISHLKKLDIHFFNRNFRIASHNNFFGSLFAASFYLYVINEDPIRLLILPSAWVFIGAAFVSMVVFYAIYIYNREKVAKNRAKHFILINFILYIFMFCSLTTGFGLLKKYEEVNIVLCEVLDGRNKPTEAEILIYYETESEQKFISDKNGQCQIPFRKKDLAHVKSIYVQNRIGENIEFDAGNPSSLTSLTMFLKRIKLTSK